MLFSIVNKATGTTISSKAKVASSFGLRLKGLMFREEIDDSEALIFHNTPSIHTCFMRFAIDVVFLDKTNKVIKIAEAVLPWKIVSCRGSKLTIELPANRAAKRSLKLGDSLEMVANE